MKEKELHLFIIWEHGRYKENEILADIKAHFELVKCYDILWSKTCVSSNFTRFYGTNLPPNSEKEKECGIGRFLLVVVYDHNPVYKVRSTSKGNAVVNVNMFDAKSKYRNWTGGGHKIHATNSYKETNHDLTLILGINVEDFVKKISDTQVSGTEYVECDVAGAKGWESLLDLFYVLNNTINYVVLRGGNELLQNKFSDEHRDVDLLVDDYQNTKYLINGISCCSESRPHEKVTIGGYDYFLDLWPVQKYYFDPQWCQEMLDSKVFSDGFYFLNDRNELYSLIYHCLIYKNRISVDYQKRIRELLLRLSIVGDDLYKILVNFLESNSYEIYFAPLDSSLIVHMDNVIINEYAFRNGYLFSRSDIFVDGEKYLTKVYSRKDSYYKVATKYLIEREYAFLTELKNEPYFPKVIDYGQIDSEYGFIEISRCKGVNPIEFFKSPSHQHLPCVKGFFEELLNVVKILIKHNIIHRDLMPQNILVYEKDGRCCISVIDFGWSAKIGEGNVITPNLLGLNYHDAHGYSDVYSLGEIAFDIYKYHTTRYEMRIGELLKLVTSDWYEGDIKVLEEKIDSIQMQLPLTFTDWLSEWRCFVRNRKLKELFFSLLPYKKALMFRHFIKRMR